MGRWTSRQRLTTRRRPGARPVARSPTPSVEYSDSPANNTVSSWLCQVAVRFRTAGEGVAPTCGCCTSRSRAIATGSDACGPRDGDRAVRGGRVAPAAGVERPAARLPDPPRTRVGGPGRRGPAGHGSGGRRPRRGGSLVSRLRDLPVLADVRTRDPADRVGAEAAEGSAARVLSVRDDLRRADSAHSVRSRRAPPIARL